MAIRILLHTPERIICLLTAISFFYGKPVAAQEVFPRTNDTLFSTYYHQRYTHFRSLPLKERSVVFLGNSITDGAEWTELFDDSHILNRGISGDITLGILHRLQEVTSRKPSKIFLLIGINDLARGIAPDSICRNILLISRFIRENSPSTKIYIQSLLPVNERPGMFPSHMKRKEGITVLNSLLESAAMQNNFYFVDLFTAFCDEKGRLDLQYTNDGLHLNGTGYCLWKRIIYPYVYDFSQNPAVLPSPSFLEWGSGVSWIHELEGIRVGDSSFYREAQMIKSFFSGIGYPLPIEVNGAGNQGKKYIYLERKVVQGHMHEGYALSVTETGITLSASDKAGIYYAGVTLLQLARDHTAIPFCRVTDSPAFSWRGFLIDVGRNYVSVEKLREIIDRMAQYKLNVFHFHVTENVAWRLEVPGFPTLISTASQTRHKGAFYSVAEVKALMNYCEERHILFLPEIDMPGHSDAFTRATGFDMQSDSGKSMLRRILIRMVDTYKFTHIHIGADEVRIRDTGFIPGISALLQSKNVALIGWQPGGNFPQSVVRQLWVGGAGIQPDLMHNQVIDSKHLYINHMDPQESVPTIYLRKILGQDAGDSLRLGATLCLWHDRAVLSENDLWKMNPLYPSMIAFAARSWEGGGAEGWRTNPEDSVEPLQAMFDSFENKLMEHKALYFDGQPFPYQRQKYIRWKLIGPYSNQGDLKRVFLPETDTAYSRKSKGIEVSGGTIIFRHWWTPLIKSVLPNAGENTTWYAFREIWSDSDRTGKFLIGFENSSRSVLNKVPPKGAWDNKGSEIWWNGNPVPAPDWKHADAYLDMETPFTDEFYTTRPPVLLKLRKGWNTVMVKCPVAGFQQKPGEGPVKWMFTFIEMCAPF